MRALLLLLVGATAQAQDIPHAICLQASYSETWPVVQVISGRVGHSVCSTGLVLDSSDDDTRFVLTPAHAVTAKDPTRIMARNLNVKAELVASDQKHDVALLLANCPNCAIQSWRLVSMQQIPGVNPIPSEVPRSWGGFGPDSSQYRQYTSPTQPHGVSYLWAPGELEEGMSGGPVYSEAGVLHGMIIRRSEDRSYGLAVHAGWIRQWIESLHYDDVGRVTDVLVATKPFDTPNWLPVSWVSERGYVFGKPDFSK